MPATLWITTALCLAGLCAGMVLHLKWHPLRQHFSDAWDMMLGLPWMTLIAAALWLLNGAGDPEAHTGPWSLNDLLAWSDLAVPLLRHAITGFARSLHQILPAWPLAWLLPLAWSFFLWRLTRWPYRYGSRKMSLTSQTFLIIGCMASWVWVAMEFASATRELPEWCESVRFGLRMVGIGVTAAACQVVVICLVIGWKHPEHPEQQRDAWRAVEHALARWPGIGALAGFNLLWMLWYTRPDAVATEWRDWLLPEFLLFFAPLPVAVARVGGPFAHQGGCAMRALTRSIGPMLAILLTAVAVLMLVHYMIALTAHAVTDHAVAAMIFLPVHALVLATVHNWLFLAAVFTLLRYGFRTDATGACAE